MSRQQIVFSPVTRISGLLTVELTVEDACIMDARACCTMFRGYEAIMRGRHVTDAVYLTQRVCGICSTAHGAVASYLLDALYDNDIDENAQYIRNIMLGADFLQNHIRHFYLFELPDYVVMPERPPFLAQNCVDCRFGEGDNTIIAGHYHGAVQAAARSHQLLTLFGGKAPHQHSFVHGGAAVAPTADIITQASFLLKDIRDFVQRCMLSDTEAISRRYDDYYHIGETSGRMLSFGLFRFDEKNGHPMWKGGVLDDGRISAVSLGDIAEDVTHAWFRQSGPGETEPAPRKPGAYTWTKSVQYGGRHCEGGPLARMLINGYYDGGTSVMDRIMARSLETYLITELMAAWLTKLKPGPAPISQKKEPAARQAIAVTDAMRGPLLHSAVVADGSVTRYDIITPTGWNFSPRDEHGRRGPVETALAGTVMHSPDLTYIVAGRIIRSFDPCIACATH